MNNRIPDDNEVLDFCWDRNLTRGEIREQLSNAKGGEWLRVASWILREAACADVWSFFTPRELREHLTELSPFLGRRKRFWQYIIGEWHELGKI